MKIQFELGQVSHKRHFFEIIEEMKKRGHEVVETASTKDSVGHIKMRMVDGDHRDLMAFDVYTRDDELGALSYALRACRDYLCYLKEEYKDSLIIKSRIRNMLKFGIESMPEKSGEKLCGLLEVLSRSDADTDSLDAMLSVFESMLPVRQDVVDYLKEIDADVICITPYILTQYGQAEIAKAAKHLGIPLIFLVGSWDNLTSKGAVQVQPDYTLVWNSIQIEEAVKYHKMDRDRVFAVGAARFDDFWERRPNVSRKEYLGRLGLDEDRKTILYLGSSNLISSDEKVFVRRWLNMLRNSGNEILRDANVILRPHPKFTGGWVEEFKNDKNVGMSLSGSDLQKALNNDEELFHCMTFSDAVFGANTSAELEAAIVRRPVFTIIDEFFNTGQSGTLHFKYLAGALAQVAHSLEEHFDQIGSELLNPAPASVYDAFLAGFLRPCGLEKRASAVTVDTVEKIVGDVKPRSGTKITLPEVPKKESFLSNVKRIFK